MSSGGGVGEPVQTRVLVAFGEEHRAYREVIAAGIRILRPSADVAVSTPAELEDEIARFDPRVVICGAPGTVDAGDRPAWVELPMEPNRPAKIRVGDSRRSPTNPTLEDLLGIIDEAENLLRARADRRGDRGAPESIHPTS